MSKCVRLSWGPPEPGHGKNVITSFAVEVRVRDNAGRCRAAVSLCINGVALGEKAFYSNNMRELAERLLIVCSCRRKLRSKLRVVVPNSPRPHNRPSREKTITQRSSSPCQPKATTLGDTLSNRPFGPELVPETSKHGASTTPSAPAGKEFSLARAPAASTRTPSESRVSPPTTA